MGGRANISQSQGSCAPALQGSPEELRHAAEVNAADAVPHGKVEPGVSYAEKAKAV
jgi:hypothetical protein